MKSKNLTIKEALQAIIDYPQESEPRRDEKGYPTEVVYDDFAYKRIVDSYRDALRKTIKDYLADE